ncbi:glutamate--putrescine ligase [Pseudoxanthobacter soli DSM 19599]|uniref:Glutamate--putrescine ligase n=1 Tax=Pseudoxanthobacter soli DSM 19599 TaxID=1123029 RepID=A0A1M7ZL17_9HYPH|nr:glutamine synthetase family protein [Pseudoxanthobacter soli]SHO65571.1 glutamate--putrescine ligase [Pseudoxanthobacter soli DSM 19599]
MNIQAPDAEAVRPRGAAPVEEAQEFLDAHPEIVAIDLVLVDANGIGRGKIVRRHELMAIYRNGRHLPGSILGLDVTGEDVEETGLVWSDGDADRRAWPVPGSLVAMPWTSPPRAQVQLTLHELDGSPMMADPRHVLAWQDERLRRQGRRPVLAFELEFYLLDREPCADGTPRPARLPVTGERPETIQVYGVQELDRLEPFIDAVYRAAEAQRLPVETMISEYAPGQYELTLRHRDDALRAADDLAMLKRLLRGLAARHGMIASFMAKPFADRAGSGMHLHASLADETGANLFADREGQVVPLLAHAVAGLLDTMADGMLVFAPHQNSWRRFSAGSYSPIAPNWGTNNRSVAVRLPAGPAPTRHLEQRVAGVDANPYLVGAAILAGIRQGIERALDPGEPVSGNGYATAKTSEIPSSWHAAIGRAAGSAFLRDEALGPVMHDVFLALKRAEYARFARDISPFEYRTYLETV